MDKDDLEQMIDSEGLTGVLDLIAEICHEKSDHVSSNWQDKDLAKLWTNNAKKIEKFVSTLEEI